nr:nitroreductase [Sphingosinicella soli]
MALGNDVDVSEAIATRRSVRGFLDRPVDPALLRGIVEKAARAPSGGNLQPWHIYVVGGDELTRLKEIMAQRITEVPRGEEMEYDIYPKTLGEPYASRRFQVGEDMYGRIGIPREDRDARRRWFARNFMFFGAPVALFCYVSRTMGPPQWSDLGMYLENVMLLLREAGLDSCPQECWAMYPKTIGAFLDAPDAQMLFTGMAIGWKDPDDPANTLHAKRVPLAEFAEFRGI